MSERILAYEAERERRRAHYGFGKPVICELCATGQHRRCVRPCVCRDGHKMSEGR